MKLRHALLSLVLAAGTAAAVPPGYESEPEPMAGTFGAFSGAPCIDGFATVDGLEFHCENVDVLSYLPLSDMGCGGFTGNDIWGWTDSDTGREYALMGCTNGTSFVDVSDPLNPEYLGFLPTQTGISTWRDVKVYADHAYVVSDGNGAHGMQVFDLTRLRTVASPPETFTNDAWYGGINSSHNVAINEDTGYAYLVGGSAGGNTCSGGLHIVNIQEPQSPVFEACRSQEGYTHDTQCVIYHGPDEEYQGREICFNSNGGSGALAIVDVTEKNALTLLSNTPYAGAVYAHQGWLTEDQRYFLLNDELDELNFDHNTRTYIWDVGDLESPIFMGFHESTEPAVDHNLYVKGNYTYQSNYTAGLRILDLEDIANGNLSETAYFNFMPHDQDLGPEHDKDGPGFNGTWSNYPFFDSGIVIVSVRGTRTPDPEPGGLWTVHPGLPGITGVVTRDDTGEQLAGVRVEIEGVVAAGSLSGADGSYRVGAVPGSYQVTASLEGYPDEIVSAEVTEDGLTFLDIVLQTPPGELQVFPSTHDFGEVVAGQASAPLEVTVSNAVPEPARALDLSGIEISGDPEFGLTGAGTCDGETQLAALESCTVEVIFSPDLSGGYAGEINIATDDGQSAAVSVSGTGLPSEAAVLAVEPDTLDFGDVFIGDVATATLIISNAAEGDAVDLVLTQLEVLAGTAAFSSDGGTCAEDTALAPGQSCTVDVQFSPVSASAFSGVLRVEANGGQRNVSLSGSGVEPEPVVFEDRFEEN